MKVNFALGAAPVAAKASGKGGAVQAGLDIAISLLGVVVDSSNEEVRLKAARVMSNNAAGMTDDETHDMAARVRDNGGVSLTRSMNTLIALIGTGKVDRNVMENSATAVAMANRVQGTRIEDLAAIFAKLRDDPVKQSEELNSSHNYLAEEERKRIRSLEKAGKREEAVDLAQTLFANALRNRSLEISKSGNFFFKAAQAVSDIGGVMKDRVGDFGRLPATKSEQIAEIDKWLKSDREKRAEAVARLESGGGSAVAGYVQSQDRRIAELERRKEALVAEVSREGRKADLQRSNAREARRENSESSAPEQEKDARKNAPSTSRTSADSASTTSRSRIAAQGRGAGIQRAQVEGLMPGIEVACCHCKAEVSKTEGGGVRKESAEPGEQPLAGLDATSQANALKTSEQATEKIWAQVDAQRAQNELYGLSTEEVAKLNVAQAERQFRELDATENVDPRYIQSLEKRVVAERALLEVTQTSESNKRGGEKKKTEEEEREKKAKKMSDDIGGVFREGFVNLLEGGGRDAFDKIGQGLKKKLVQSLADAFYDATLKEAVDGFSKWLSGSIRDSMSGGGGDAKSGSGLLSGVGGIFRAVSGLVGGFSGSTSAGLANIFGGSDPLGSMVGFMGLSSAKGNVFASPGLHAYANSVVGKPTFFPFANGIGLMGEAGPEAIMPLRRGSDGRLGVSAQGASGGGALHFAPTNVFNIDSRSDRGAVMADLDRALQANNRGQMEQLKRMRVVPQ